MKPDDNTLTLTRFKRIATYEPTPDEPPFLGMYVDVETTGLDPEVDEIIELAIQPFLFTASGRVICTLDPLTGREQPSKPIPPLVTTITGITDEMVAGLRINDSAVENLVVNAEIVVAHNAEFDRQFCERRIPIFQDLRWGCSNEDVPWREIGLTSTKLEWLLFKHCGMFYDAHGAEQDCAVGVHLLSTKLPNGHTALEAVLSAMRETYARIYATDAPFEVKDALKARGYRWNPKKKVWWIDVPVDGEHREELKWLAAEGGCVQPTVYRFNARKRFSNRIGR